MAITQEEQASITPDEVIQRLKDGNARYVAGQNTNRDLMAEVNQTSTGQYPIATVLCCIDSRVLAESIFDQGIGDIFSVQLAGNVVDGDALGSMEFATKLAGTKAIVVLGHTACGAVKGAIAGAELGSLTGLLNKIKPAHEEAGTDDPNVVAAVNARRSVQQILNDSPTIKELVDNGDITIKSAMYDISTGVVSWD